MNVKEAAARLEISQSLVYSLISSGKLRACGTGSGAARSGSRRNISPIICPPRPACPSARRCTISG